MAVILRDAGRQLGPIGTFTPYPELNGILKKVDSSQTESLASVVTNRGLYRYSDLAYEEQPEELSKTADRRIAPSSFDRMQSLFTDDRPDDGREYIRILGRKANERVYKWFRLDYVKDVSNLHHYKVVISKASGTGAFGETLAQPIVCGPDIGFTETYISIGQVDSEDEANAILKYIETKFARALHSVLKVTQNDARPMWAKVPLQDFTSSSDIDWSQSVADIDRQLYKKYGLSQDEIDFIESHVKEMK